MKQKQLLGFSIVEVITAVAVIGILASIGYVSFSGVREESRDSLRMTDIDQLQLTMRLYMEQYGVNVACGGGLKIDGNSTVTTLASGTCADGPQILAFIEKQVGHIPHDPRGPGDADYFYYYDASHNCVSGGRGTPLIYAVNLETEDSNKNEVCSDATGNDGGYQNTTGYGGSINPSQPYVRAVANMQ